MALFPCNVGNGGAENIFNFSVREYGGAGGSSFQPENTKEDWQSVKIVVTNLNTQLGNRLDIFGENGSVLVRQYTSGTYTYTRNQFASPIKRIEIIAYDTNPVTLTITVN